jgi:hypothetical protein
MKHLIFAALTLGFISCTEISKKQYISSYESFINEASDKYSHFDDKMRNEADEKFKQFSEVEYKKYISNLTAEERAKVNQLTGKYYAIVAKQKGTELTREFENLVDKTKGVLNELNK